MDIKSTTANAIPGRSTNPPQGQLSLIAIAVGAVLAVVAVVVVIVAL